MLKINESFECANCKKNITKADQTCRNHCPFCFTSLHVDGDIPGDRKAQCKGIMRATNYKYKSDGVRILFVCSSCGKEHRNKQAKDDDIDFLIGNLWKE